MKFRTLLLGLSALSIASAAAFFSVTGLSKLFAGASLAIIIMASTLEFGKLITASFLHEHWKRIGFLLKTYLTIGVTVLVLITSMGIYGFLTAAYQKTADELTKIDRQVEVIELKKSRFEEQLNSFIDERVNLSNSITELTKGLSNNVIQYTDSTGRLITTTSSSTRRVLNDQLDDAKIQRDNISLRIEALTDSVTSLDIQILEIEGGSELAAEVGPLKYMSEITGLPMSSVVNIFALLIVFVFDPLAISLVLAFNTSLKIDKGEMDKKKVVEKRELYGEETDEEESQLWDNTLQDGLEDDEWDEDDINDDKLQSEISENSFEDDMDEEEPVFDKADLNKDGIVSEEERRLWYEQGGWKDTYKGQPYYMHPWFDWNKKERWINNRRAVEHWLNFQGGSRKALREIKEQYPSDFDSKTY